MTLKSDFSSRLASRLAVAAAALAVQAGAVAQQDNVPASLEHIGVVNVSQIFRESIYIKQIRDTINSGFTERTERLSELKTSAEKKSSQLNRERISLTENDLANLRSEIDRLEVRIKQEERNLVEDKRLAFDSRQRELEEEVRKVIMDLAKERKHYIVLELSSILFAEQSVDFTSEIIERLDASKAEAE